MAYEIKNELLPNMIIVHPSQTPFFWILYRIQQQLQLLNQLWHGRRWNRVAPFLDPITPLPASVEGFWLAFPLDGPKLVQIRSEAN